MNKQNNNKDNKNGGPSLRTVLPLILAALVLTVVINSIVSAVSGSYLEQITWSDFMQMVDNNEIHSIQIQSDRILVLTREQAEKTLNEQQIYYTGLLPKTELTDLIDRLVRQGVGVQGEIVEEMSPIVSFLVSWVLPIVVMYGLFTLLMSRLSKNMGGGMSIGQNKAKVYMEKQTGVTFADVAGQEEAKEALEEIIDFLHNPQKYAAIGAKLPKGALLVGPPGTGKTLLAKAVAGEANVPFFSISGSEFVEMFVGVGASRVRSLFQEANKQAPAIIFIDEIDAIGKSRDNRYSTNDEREQTLNQLLSEIDGFDSSKGVVILAATNRPDVLDKALLRAGRFDRRIVVDRPNLQGRYQTLKVHTRGIKLAEDVDLNRIAQATAGAVGADLANLVNEAALRAVRKGRQAVNQQDLLVSFETVIAGTEKKGTVLTDMEKRIVSYHECGHALVAALEKHAQPVAKITIVPHTTGALGYTMQMPEEEKFLNSKDELLTELRTLLGGRAAEQLVFGTQTTGAANDIQKATTLARSMVMQYGMSDRFGLMALTQSGNDYLDGTPVVNCADTTAADADAEVRQLLKTCYDAAINLLRENRSLLDEVALYLLEKETITGEELMQYVNADRQAICAGETDKAEDPAE